MMNFNMNDFGQVNAGMPNSPKRQERQRRQQSISDNLIDMGDGAAMQLPPRMMQRFQQMQQDAPSAQPGYQQQMAMAQQPGIARQMNPMMMRQMQQKMQQMPNFMQSPYQPPQMQSEMGAQPPSNPMAQRMGGLVF